jgi:hypothetical protein
MDVPRRKSILLICACYLLGAAAFGSINLDWDERVFVTEPYELLGGDYMKGYLAAGEVAAAAKCAMKSYFFYWYYRPMFAPLIEERHLHMFAPEEERFGYRKPERAQSPSEVTLDRYKEWLIVPEPDSWYHHGAGKPLLPAVLTVPALVAVDLVTRGGPTLLDYEFTRNYHPVFILVRLPHLLAGLVSILLVYGLLRKEQGERKAVLGTAIFAFFPLTLQSFPNLHHDAIMVPFIIATSADLLRGKHWRAGIWYGLALASKNSAVVLLPALVLLGVAKFLERRRSGGRAVSGLRAAQFSRGVLLFLLFSLLALLPFANPISYAKEVLTPFVERQYDPRGEDVAQFTLSARLGEPLTVFESQSRRRPEIMFLTRLDAFDVAAFFIILAVLLAAPRVRGDLARLSLYMTLLALPYQVIFLPGLIYRYLVFLPFFVFLVSDLAEERHLKRLLVFVVVVDAVMLIDPITVNIAHIMQGSGTLWTTLLGR